MKLQYFKEIETEEIKMKNKPVYTISGKQVTKRQWEKSQAHTIDLDKVAKALPENAPTSLENEGYGSTDTAEAVRKAIAEAETPS